MFFFIIIIHHKLNAFFTLLPCGLAYYSAYFSVSSGFVSLATKTYKALIGNGALTTIPVAHGLNSQDLIIQLFDASTNETVYADVVRTSASQVDVSFSVAPASNSIKILIQKI